MSNHTGVSVHNIVGCDQSMHFLTVGEVAALLRIGRSKAYELCRQPGFPAVRVGRVIRIPREAFLAWLAQHGGFHDLGRDAASEIAPGLLFREQIM